MQYPAQWRLQIAAQQFGLTDRPLASVAESKHGAKAVGGLPFVHQLILLAEK
jgi:hypothetical protein